MIRRITKIAALLIIFILFFALISCDNKGKQPAPSPTAPAETSPEADVSKEEETELIAGEIVCVPFTDDKYTLAEIQEIGDNEVTVVSVDDNRTWQAQIPHVVRFKNRNWKIGDRVMALHSTGVFHEGQIGEVREEVCLIEWESGEPATEVKKDRLLEYFEHKIEKEKEDKNPEIIEISPEAP
ncbi:MAG: hypothetical protein ACLFQV_02340 [Vulcanimicrobiota bacterium]